MASFFVHGIPTPKGSMVGFSFFDKKLGRHRAAMHHDNRRTEPWAKAIAETALAAGVRPVGGAVAVNVKFYFPRPKYHFRGNGELKADAPRWHVKKPDKDKLERAVLDALKAIAFTDDALVAKGWQEKVYVLGTEVPGAHIEIEPLSAAGERAA